MAATGENRERDGGAEASHIARLHLPVLVREVLSFFEPVPGFRCLDATLGLGGHSEALLRKARESGVPDVRVLGLDRDAEALALAEKRLEAFAPVVYFRHGLFSECGRALAELGWDGADFVLADLGVSSLQLDSPERGFSIKADAPPDMRMDRSRGKSAADLVNSMSAAELRGIIRVFGEEPLAGRIAGSISAARDAGRVRSAGDLARAVTGAYPPDRRAAARRHPAVRTFQALRMAVNDELGELDRFLRGIIGLLRPGARLLIISFHSLEDRAVKRFFREEAAGCRCPRNVPSCLCGHKATLGILTGKPLRPDAAETAANPRAGSARLRVAERLCA
ncbi:MAG: 16S rRNA (cytosine(1402)-N(4))-methyltransferase RsmH [Desulfovibrio sp.]|jgi:16S rRNA (cytosine1402-N4)-methyltransferase|nr:16S rRNA (cytosine(1402)-N(4))-methyltransferase RsmH [Desulfovibrio sp.]